jgi:hypothetical protein
MLGSLLRIVQVAEHHLTTLQNILVIVGEILITIIIMALGMLIYDRFEHGEWIWTAMIREKRRKRQARVVWYPHVKS